jgi:hypothetical protein
MGGVCKNEAGFGLNYFKTMTKQLMKTASIGLLVLMVALSSCSDNSKSEYGNLPKALIDSLQNVGQQIQHLQIDPAKDTVIKGSSGTMIYIAANSLVDDKGKPVLTKVTLALKEHYSIADFISSNLQTIHDNDILQTQGMIYLSATTSDGSALGIDKTKPIRIEFPVKERIDGTKIFTGKRDEAGNINWGEMKEPSKYLVAYPIRLISHCETNLKDFYVGEDIPDCFGFTLDPINNPGNYYVGDIDKFGNTFLATREFRERFLTAPDQDILKIYIDNLEENLWEADELVVKYLIQDSAQRKEVRRFEFESEKEMIQWQKERQDRAHRVIQAFKKFAQQKLTNIDPVKRVIDTTYAEMNRAFTSFDALDFGWVNVDHFYNDPKAENVKLMAATNEPAQMVYLILPERNIILSGIQNDDKQYWFTKKEDGYNKLPKGEKAILVAIGLVDNEVLFADKEIVIGKNEIETLSLKKASSKEIKTRLAGYKK